MPTAYPNAAWAPFGNSALPIDILIPLAASAQGGRGQFLTASPSTGNASLNDGATPNQIAVGVVYPTDLSAISTVAGSAATAVWQGWASGMPASTISNDGFSNADLGVPFYIVNETTPGKLSSSGGSNRSLGGLVFGLDDDGTPRLWGGIVAWLLARLTLVANAFPMAWYSIADASASTATLERSIPRAAVHGVVTSVQFVGAAVVADNTDYITATIAKRSAADAYANATTIATYDSRAANQGAITAFTPANFLLSATAANLNLLETDIVTLTVVKGGAGKSLTGDIMVNGKAI